MIEEPREHLNKQESKEMEYFQKLQLRKQQNAALRVELGKANSEIQHLTHLLEQKVTSEMMVKYAVTKNSCKSKYARAMAELIALKEKAQQVNSGEVEKLKAIIQGLHAKNHWFEIQLTGTRAELLHMELTAHRYLRRMLKACKRPTTTSADDKLFADVDRFINGDQLGCRTKI